MMKRLLKFVIRLSIVLFVLFNTVVILHAYKFTHFNAELDPIYKPPKHIPTPTLVKYAVTGIDIPRPKAMNMPPMPFVHRQIQSDVLLDAWLAYRNICKGIVIVCHGYGNEKSGMNNVANYFYQAGYNTLQFDFRGSGDSGGDEVTVGYKEAQNVVDAYNYVKQEFPNEPIFLFGASMGAVAIMKAMTESDMQPQALLLECPFGSMQQTVAARFKLVGLPQQPIVPFLMFWGGAINGFNAFGFQPTQYAQKITTPTLLMIGGKDQFVSMEETNAIFTNLAGKKELSIFPQAIHENYLNHDAPKWKKHVADFMKNLP